MNLNLGGLSSSEKKYLVANPVCFTILGTLPTMGNQKA